MGMLYQPAHRIQSFNGKQQVFEKIKIGWEKIKEVAGFLFSWTDILETKNSIKAVLNAGLDLGGDKLDSFVPQIDRYVGIDLGSVDLPQLLTFYSFFGGIQDQVVKALSPASTSVSGDDANKGGGTASEVQSSTSYKWTGERLKNGGTGAGAVVQSSSIVPDAQLQRTILIV